MRPTSRPDHHTLAEALRLRVLDGPGETDRAIREAAAKRAAGGPAMEAPMMTLRARSASLPLVSRMSRL